MQQRNANATQLAQGANSDQNRETSTHSAAGSARIPAAELSVNAITRTDAWTIPASVGLGNRWATTSSQGSESPWLNFLSLFHPLQRDESSSSTYLCHHLYATRVCTSFCCRRSSLGTLILRSCSCNSCLRACVLLVQVVFPLRLYH
jgi:hypothetical protein